MAMRSARVYNNNELHKVDLQMSNPSFPELGYIYHPDSDTISPGYPRLDVILRQMPSRQHFDPDSVRAPVFTLHTHGLELLKISHPWYGGDQKRRLCAGKVIISDYKDKLVEAFTFGGELVIQTSDQQTVCIFTSPAPILPFEHNPVDLLPGDIATLLGSEAEVLMAQRRAHWLHRPAELENRLGNIEPMRLYCACIAALEAKFAHPSMNDSDEYRHFLWFLHTEHRHLQDTSRWCDPVSLDQLL